MNENAKEAIEALDQFIEVLDRQSDQLMRITAGLDKMIESLEQDIAAGSSRQTKAEDAEEK